jgi:glutathione S-transferase
MSMAQFVVHSVPGSPYGRAVLATLEEKGARYRLVPVAPGTLRTPQHLLRHPFGRIPVLEHEDFTLYETQAILRYLDRVLPDPALTPAGARAAARMDQMMNVADWYVFQGVGTVIPFHRIVAPRVLGRAPDEAAIAAVMPKAHGVFDALERALDGTPYFGGNAASLADLLLAPHVDFFAETPEWQALTAHHPNIKGWIERMRERPSMQATTWDRVASMAEARVA